MYIANMRSCKLTEREEDLLCGTFQAAIDDVAELGSSALTDENLAEIKSLEAFEDGVVPVFILPNGIPAGLFANEAAGKLEYQRLPVVVNVVGDKLVVRHFESQARRAEQDRRHKAANSPKPSPRFFTSRRVVGNDGQPTMTVTRIGVLVTDDQVELVGAYFNTLSADGPIVGYIIQADSGFEVCHCGEKSVHPNWTAAWDEIAWVLARPDDFLDDEWVELPYGTRLREIRRLVKGYGPDEYKLQQDLWRHRRENGW